MLILRILDFHVHILHNNVLHWGVALIYGPEILNFICRWHFYLLSSLEKVKFQQGVFLLNCSWVA